MYTKISQRSRRLGLGNDPIFPTTTDSCRELAFTQSQSWAVLVPKFNLLLTSPVFFKSYYSMLNFILPARKDIIFVLERTGLEKYMLLKG